MPLLLASALAAGFFGSAVPPPIARCMTDHKPGNVYRHPITPMHTAKPRNPLEDPFPVCTDKTAEEQALG